MAAPDPFAVARQVSSLADSAVVFFSAGKDSLACLDVCNRFFKRIAIVYMYITPGLSFHEEAIRRAEKRYPGLEVLRLPHWMLSLLLRSASLRQPSRLSLSVASVKYKDVEARARELTGISWVAGGQKIIDSLERRGMISRCAGVDHERRRFYPLAHWNDAYVLRYLRRRRIQLPADYAILGGSYDGTLFAYELREIKRHFPADFDRIAERFPHVHAELMRADMTGEHPSMRGWGRWQEQGEDCDEWRERHGNDAPPAVEAPALSDGADGAVGDGVRSVQPPHSRSPQPAETEGTSGQEGVG